MAACELQHESFEIAPVVQRISNNRPRSSYHTGHEGRVQKRYMQPGKHNFHSTRPPRFPNLISIQIKRGHAWVPPQIQSDNNEAKDNKRYSQYPRHGYSIDVATDTIVAALLLWAYSLHQICVFSATTSGKDRRQWRHLKADLCCSHHK